MLHSPGVVQYSPKRSSSVTEVTSRGVSSSPSDASPCGSPVKKFAAVNERSNKPTPTQLPWTHIKIQTQPKGTKSFFTVWISFSTPVLLILKCKFWNNPELLPSSRQKRVLHIVIIQILGSALWLWMFFSIHIQNIVRCVYFFEETGTYLAQCSVKVTRSGRLLNRSKLVRPKISLFFVQVCHKAASSSSLIPNDHHAVASRGTYRLLFWIKWATTHCWCP